MEILLSQILPYVIGAAAVFVAGRLGIKLPFLPAPAPSPEPSPAPAPAPSPSPSPAPGPAPLPVTPDQLLAILFAQLQTWLQGLLHDQFKASVESLKIPTSPTEKLNA